MPGYIVSQALSVGPAWRRETETKYSRRPRISALYG